MKPKAGYDYLATAAHFAAESSTGTNVNVCTTDDFTKSVDALVYYIDPDSEEMSGLRSTSTTVTAGPCLDTGQMAAKLLEQGVVIDPGGADLDFASTTTMLWQIFAQCEADELEKHPTRDLVVEVLVLQQEREKKATLGMMLASAMGCWTS